LRGYLDFVTTDVRIERTAAPAETEKTPTQSIDSTPTDPPPIVANAACANVLIARSPAKLQNSRLKIVMFAPYFLAIFISRSRRVCGHDDRQQGDPAVD